MYNRQRELMENANETIELARDILQGKFLTVDEFKQYLRDVDDVLDGIGNG